MTELEKIKAQIEERHRAIARKKKALELKMYGGIEWPNGEMRVTDLPGPLAPDFDLGYKVEHEGETWVSVAKLPRKIVLELSSWVGTAAIGAVHYYGKLNFPWSYFECLTAKPELALPTELEPPPCKVRCFTLVRPITAKEVADSKDRHSRWYGYRVGEMTNCFDTAQQVVDEARRVAKSIFPEWEYVEELEGWEDDLKGLVR